MFAQSGRRISILDRSVSKGKNEVSMTAFALLFAEVVRYAQSRVNSVPDLQTRLASFGSFVGAKLTDVICFREKGYKREVKLLNMLMFIKSTLLKNIFGKEADKLERSSENPRVYYIIESEPTVSTFISIPKDRGTLNVASFTGGVIEAVLKLNNFPCKVTTVWHNGTTYVIEFDESVLAREKFLEGR